VLRSCQAELRLTERLYDVWNIAKMSCEVQGVPHIWTSQQERNTDSVIWRSEIAMKLYRAKCDIDWMGMYLKSYFYQHMNRAFADEKGFILFFYRKETKWCNVDGNRNLQGEHKVFP